MKGRCFNCGGCTAKGSASTTSTASAGGTNGDAVPTKKLAKVKAAPKSPTMGQSGEPPKGKSTIQLPWSSWESLQPKLQLLMREATGPLKSIRSLKAVRIKPVGEGQFGVPGEVALLDGGATHGLRQARPEEEGELTPTTVHLACGTVVLYRYPKHQTLPSREPIEPIIPLSWFVSAGYKITWCRDCCTIYHDTCGALQCHMRGGCPVMDGNDGLAIDLVGPYLIGRDDGRRRKGKYIMVATVPLPLLERSGDSEEMEAEQKGDDVNPAESEAKGPHGGDQSEVHPACQSLEERLVLNEEGNAEVEMVDERDAKGLNQEWLNYVEGWTSERHHCGGVGVEAYWPHSGGH